MLPGMHEDGVDGDVFDGNDVLTLGGIDGNGDHSPIHSEARQLMSKEMCGSNLQLDCVILANAGGFFMIPPAEKKKKH